MLNVTVLINRVFDATLLLMVSITYKKLKQCIQKYTFKTQYLLCEINVDLYIIKLQLALKKKNTDTLGLEVNILNNTNMGCNF